MYAERWTWCVAGWLLLGGATASPATARELWIEDRVDAQRAIEQVLWNHRIWPQENRGPNESAEPIEYIGLRPERRPRMKSLRPCGSFYEHPRERLGDEQAVRRDIHARHRQVRALRQPSTDPALRC